MRTWLRRVLDRLGPNGKVRFARLRAAFWGLLGIASVPLGWANSVALVWAASVYANIASEVAAGEAADDQEILDRLDRLETKLDYLLTYAKAYPSTPSTPPESKQNTATATSVSVVKPLRDIPDTLSS